MRVRQRFLTCLTSAAVAAAPASGAVFLSIDELTYAPGDPSPVLLGVYASSDAGDVVSGFNLPFDYNNDGYVDADRDGVGDLPAGFARADPFVRQAVYANTGFDTPQPQITLVDVDGIATGSGANVALGTGRTRLFSLAIDVAPAVPVGTVLPFQIVVPDAPFTPLFEVAGPSSPTVAAPTPGAPVFGSITIVPEPATLAVAGMAASGLTRRRRRLPA